MKNKQLILPLALALGFSLAGCDKSSDSSTGTSSGNGNDGTATSSTASGQPGGPIEIKLQWPVGARYVQSIELDQEMQTSMARMPQPMKQQVDMSQEFGLEVVAERPDGGCEVEMEFMGMQMNVSAGGREVVNFDSHGESLDGGKNPMATLFRNMVGTRFKFILDNSNSVVRMEGLQEFRNRVITNSPAVARSPVAQMMSEDYFKQMINFGQGLPNRPVSPGDSWPVQTEIAMGPMGIMQLDMQYIYKGIEERDKRNCAVLDFTGIMKTKPGRETSNPNMKMNIDDGKTSGRSWFDIEKGMVIATEVDQDMKMTIEMSGMLPPGAGTNEPPTRTMTTVMNQKINVTITPE